MSDLTLRTCNICLSEYIPLDQVVFFQCGHHACRSCSEQRSYRDDPSCAECRKPKGIPHRIYLSSDDLVNEPAGHIIDNLNEINGDDSAERIASASKKLKRFSGVDRENSDISRALLAAARDLEERVVPLAALYNEANKQNEELLNRLQLLQSKSAGYKSKASQAKDIAELRRQEELRHRERAAGYLSVIKQKNLELDSLQTELKERDKREILMKTKLKALAKSQRPKSTKMSHVGDTSLHVEARPASPVAKHPAPTVLKNYNSPHANPVKGRKHVQHRDRPSRVD